MEAPINGIGIYYVDTGKDAGRPSGEDAKDAGKREASPVVPVVFVHGMTFDHAMWRPQMDLLESRRRVIAYDLRGHGKSGVGDGQYTYRLFVEDLRSLLDHLGIEAAVLCGLSMGGAVALRTAELYPERVRGLVLCDTTCKPDTDESKQRRESAIQSIKRDGLAAFADAFLKTVFAPGSFSVHAETIESIRETMVSSSPLGLCGALLAQAARTDQCRRLDKISVPALLVVGSEDTLTPPSLMREMHERIPKSEFHVIPDAAHVSNLENTAEFNRVLVDFLDKIA